MIAKNYATPQDTEQAFYRAFELADLVEMMAIWAEEEEIVCVHPNGGRHCGLVEVRESWRQIFSQGPRLRFRLAVHHASPLAPEAAPQEAPPSVLH